MKMMELCLWRASIGRFCLACVSRLLSNRFREYICAKGKDTVQVSIWDIFLLWLYLCVLANIGICLKQLIVCAIFNPLLPDSQSDKITTTVTSVVSLSEAMFMSPIGLSEIYSSHIQCLSESACVLFAFALRLVRLSNDVEENPGPRQADKPLCENMDKLEQALQSKLDNILQQIQSQTETLKRQEDLLKQFSAEQVEMKKAVTALRQDVNDMKCGLDQNAQSINTLCVKQEDLSQSVSRLEDEIDRLEGFSRRNNIKLFGIPEEDGLREDCAEAVRNVLQTYIPEIAWQSDVIERAHRLGRSQRNSNPRPIIAKFQRWGDAMTLMKHREARADMDGDGLRVAQDLTRRQSQQLRQLREQGKSGYFVNGTLRIKESTRPRHTERERGDPSTTQANRWDTGKPHYHRTARPINDVESAVDVINSSQQPTNKDASANRVGKPTQAFRDTTQGPRTRSATRGQSETRQAADDNNKQAANNGQGSSSNANSS